MRHSKRCEHEAYYTVGRWVWCFEGGESTHRRLEQRECATCGTWLPIGPSDEAPVAVEVRAAELAAEWTPEHGALPDASAREDVGWLIAARDLPFVTTNAEEEAGYLAHAIAHHDEEQAAGQALSDVGTTEGA